MKPRLNLLAAGTFLAAFANAVAQPTFTKITTGAIVNDGGSSYAGTWADYDADGDLDLVVAVTMTVSSISSSATERAARPKTTFSTGTTATPTRG